MKILIPYDTTTTGMKNPYLFLLMRDLVKQDAVSQVISGHGWLYEDLDVDVIHLHWPELLVKPKLPDMSQVHLLKDHHFQKTLNALREKKKRGASIILTVHNESPHKDNDSRFSEFYSNVYALADGFIHMGHESERLIGESHQTETDGKYHTVIPHGNYEWFGNTIPRKTCRDKLGINPEEHLLLSFGAIRTEDELNMGIRAFKQAGVPHSVFMMAGQIPYPYKSQPKHFSVRKQLYANHFNKTIRTVEKTIAPDQVQLYLNSADLVFIQRFHSLNSGNVALGFTFGRVVVGPNYGVIGETLKETGNPVFDPFSIASVAEAIREGFRLSENGHGDNNRQYALEKMRWPDIAANTVEAYKMLAS